MFEQHERWLEELREHVNREEAVSSDSGRMNLVAIASEVVDADADERKQTRIHIPNWESMASDLGDTLDYLGPETSVVVRDAVIELVAAINALFRTAADQYGKPQRYIDGDQRPAVRKCAAALYELLDQDDTIIAAWRDLVAGCRDRDHVNYTFDRIAFLRDNLIALQEHRRQDPRHWGPIRTAVQIQFDDRYSISRAQLDVGDPPIPFDPRTQAEPTGLTEEQRMSLAERSLVLRPNTSDVVVWFRIANAFMPRIDCISHGDITFYAAQVLAGAIIDHDVARKTFTVVPEELLTDEISERQSSDGGVDEHYGIEHRPGMVYARIVMRDIEPHRAKAEARMHLESLLAVLHPHPDMWTILKGSLEFAGQWHPRPLEWGLKEDRERTIFHQNDYLAETLAGLNWDGHEITFETARSLQPVLQLSRALSSVPRSDPEAIVMAAVRAIEHCNSWTTKGRKTWTEFINSYLLDVYTRIAFLQRASRHTFDAIVVTLPDRSPDAVPQRQLQDIREEVDQGTWGRQFHLEVAIKHIGTLKAIYDDHPLVRPLTELDDILQSGRSIGDAVDRERDRVRARVARLTRSRNAAIHGGPLSTAACESIADFAIDLAEQALHTATQAIIRRQPIADYMRLNREENQQRIDALKRSGDQRLFFVDNPME